MSSLVATYTLLGVVGFYTYLKSGQSIYLEGSALFVGLVALLKMTILVTEVLSYGMSSLLVPTLRSFLQNSLLCATLIVVLIVVLTALGNFSRKRRSQVGVQMTIWLLAVLSLLLDWVQYGFNFYFLKSDLTGTIKPGWHTVIAAPLSYMQLFSVFAMGLLFIFGWKAMNPLRKI